MGRLVIGTQYYKFSMLAYYYTLIDFKEAMILNYLCTWWVQYNK